MRVMVDALTSTRGASGVTLGVGVLVGVGVGVEVEAAFAGCAAGVGVGSAETLGLSSPPVAGSAAAALLGVRGVSEAIE
jgi:hypothetical protein